MEHYNNQEGITLESLYAYLHESSREFNERIKEEARKRDEEAKKRAKEFELERLERAESWRQLRESQKETDRQLRESKKKTDEEMRKLTRDLGGIGNGNGDVAEEYFTNAFRKNPTLNGEIFDIVSPNVRPIPEIRIDNKVCDDEYDIFLANGKSVAIIEVKYNLKKDKAGKLLQKAENFRKYYPKYKDYKLYLGIAALSFKRVTEERILKAGIAVIKQVGDKMVINSENLKVF